MYFFSIDELISFVEGPPIMDGYKLQTKEVIRRVVNYSEPLLPLMSVSVAGNYIVQTAEAARRSRGKNYGALISYDSFMGNFHFVIVAIYDRMVYGLEYFPWKESWDSASSITVHDFDGTVEPVRVVRIAFYEDPSLEIEHMS